METNANPVYNEGSAASLGLVGCYGCAHVLYKKEKTCPYCNAALHSRKNHSIQKTLALLFTGILFYIPANLLPMLSTRLLGSDSDSTIIGGAIELWAYGSYPIAAVIFIASVLIPLAKFCSMLWLCFSIKQNQQTLMRTRMFRVNEFIGRWSMIDVFVVAVLVAMLQMGNLITIIPGPAAVAFCGSVIMTMLAAQNFDPRLIWDNYEQ
ncbi:MAG: paraquat-inducible protein A [Pseudomonadales bacterium]|jgi:paraquat-inducible protein A